MYTAILYGHLYNIYAWHSDDIVKHSQELCIFYCHVINMPFIFSV